MKNALVWGLARDQISRMKMSALQTNDKKMSFDIIWLHIAFGPPHTGAFFMFCVAFVRMCQGIIYFLYIFYVHIEKPSCVHPDIVL